MNQTVEIYIDELVLHGFSSHDRYSIGEAVQTELSRLFSDKGVPPSFLQGGNYPAIKNLNFPMSKTMGGARVGTQIASSVFGSFETVLQGNNGSTFER